MKNPFVIAIVSGVILYAVLAALAFWAAGTWRLPFFWAVFVVQLLICFVGLGLLDPDLVRERMKPRGEDQDPWARVILSVLVVATVVLGAADVGRWHISSISAWAQIAALVFHTLGWIGLFWAMATNKFFSSAIRLQPDRAQRVIDEGPYAFIRHPGYAFASLAFLTQGIALGSWLAEIPAVLIVLDLLWRTFLEEKMLRDGLEGYRDYMEKVRYRWLPCIW